MGRKKARARVLHDLDLLARLLVGIGEVSDITGVPQRQLRYWQAKGLIEVADDPRSTTRRFDYLNLKKIVLLKEKLDEGYTLDAAAEQIEEQMARMRAAFEKRLRKIQKREEAAP